MKKLVWTICAAILSLSLAFAAGAEDWTRFRGPNGGGVSPTTGLPAEVGPDENVVWKTPLPPGHSSPVLVGDAIFLTAYDGDDLLTLRLARETGEIVWKKAAPRPRTDKVDDRNTPASASPVTDGESVYVFFPDFGLLAYDLDGNERWRHPLGPFDNVYGMGASPVLVDDKIVLVCDQSTDSYVLALSKKTGEPAWKTPRPEAKSGHSTPILYRPEGGEAQVLIPGSFLLTAYSARTGDKIWWVGGLSFEMKSTPVIDGDLLFINGFGSPLNQPGQQIEIASFADTLVTRDGDKNGLLSEEEMPDGPIKGWFDFVDLAADGHLDEADWSYLKAALASLNGMLGIRLGGQGDMTEKSTVWAYRRSVPQLPSPLVYDGILYMVNDGGVVTSFKPATGEVIRQERLREAVDQYYASPVAADGKVYMVSRRGKVSVLKPDGSLEVTAVSDLGEECYATPAIADGRLYIRTVGHLYSFGLPEQPMPAGEVPRT
jgi:outer membrane protein assembly factor BamB